MIMSKPSKEFINPKTLIAPAAAVYSHIAKVNRGTIVYISGQVSSDASGKIIGESDFEAQVEQVFAYLKVAKPPASTFVVVSRLMRPGWLIEIEAVAAIDD